MESKEIIKALRDAGLKIESIPTVENLFRIEGFPYYFSPCRRPEDTFPEGQVFYGDTCFQGRNDKDGVAELIRYIGNSVLMSKIFRDKALG